MKIAITSDLHGKLPEVPEADMLVIAGDVCPTWRTSVQRCMFRQAQWLQEEFDPWVLRAPVQQVVFVWGNHDFVGHTDYYVPINKAILLKPWQPVFINGLSWLGNPWTREFGNWAFNMKEEELDDKWAECDPVDFVVSHGPPLGYGDIVPGGERVGSEGFARYIAMHQPSVALYGHIHCDTGEWELGRSRLINNAYVDDRHEPQNPVRVIEL